MAKNVAVKTVPDFVLVNVPIKLLPDPRNPEVAKNNICRDEHDKASWKIQNMINDMELATPDELDQFPAVELEGILSEKEDAFKLPDGRKVVFDTDSLLDGYRRTEAKLALNERHPFGHSVSKKITTENPVTKQVQEIEVDFPKKYDVVKAKIYVNLTPAQRVAIAIKDVGNREGMNRAGFVKTYMALKDSNPGIGEKEIEVALASQLDAIYGPLKEGQSRHPTLQVLDRAWNLWGDYEDPSTPRGAFVFKQRFNQGRGFPTDVEVRKLYQAHRSSQEKSTDGTVNHFKPASDVEALWAKMVSDSQKEESSENVVKAKMFTRQAIEDTKNMLQSQPLLVFTRVLLNEIGAADPNKLIKAADTFSHELLAFASKTDEGRKLIATHQLHIRKLLGTATQDELAAEKGVKLVEAKK